MVDTNEAYINMLNKAGFESAVKGHYYVFTNPWESFEDISTMKTEWDLGVSKENQIDLNTAISDVQGVPSVVLVGWTFQGNTGYLWDDVFIKIGENTYRPEMVERQDVVEKTKNNEILNCGMVYVIPADVLENAERIEMIALDTKKKVKETTVITIQK